ncbi:MAG: carbonic anhydrase [Bryobacteraceae bacterium]
MPKISKIFAIVFFCLVPVTPLFGAEEHGACQPNGPCPVCDPPRTGTELDALREGNARFRADPKHLHQSADCSGKLLCCQKPFAVILSCSDSRVPAEVVFDQGFGDLFSVRLAGNVATPAALGSIEYAVDHLGAKLVVVMGHQRCGAVQAAFCPRPGPHIDGIWDLIRPAVASPLPTCEHHVDVDDKQWDHAIRENVTNMVKLVTRDLRSEPSRSEVKIVGAYYKMDDGAVELPK